MQKPPNLTLFLNWIWNKFVIAIFWILQLVIIFYFIVHGHFLVYSTRADIIRPYAIGKGKFSTFYSH